MDEHELVPAECVQPRVVAQHGCADASGVCAAAFDPCQRTLALARDDGRIQLFGGSAAEECTLASSCAAPTVALRFLRHAPYLLRVSLQSELELWDLRTCSLEACALWPGELTSVCVLPGSPFVLVGEDDGTLRCACVRNGVIEPREFALTHERLGAALPSALVALALQPDAKDGRVLVAHAGGSVCLLDLATREPVLLASCGAGLTGCAWVDSMMFASAHAGGHLRLWSLPEAAAPWRATPPQPAAACASAGTLLGDGDGDVALLGTVRVVRLLCSARSRYVPEAVACSPVGSRRRAGCAVWRHSVCSLHDACRRRPRALAAAAAAAGRAWRPAAACCCIWLRPRAVGCACSAARGRGAVHIRAAS
jgi:hypothetical protein